jgi:hypothetical protein
VLNTVRPALTFIQSDASVSIRQPAPTQDSIFGLAPAAGVEATSAILTGESRP